mgnify:CR=1 FL=1
MKMVTHFLYNTATATINHLYFLIIVFCNMFRHHTHCEIRTALSGEGTAAEQCRTTQDRGRGKGGSFCACWVFLCICNPLNTDMDYRIVIVCACCSACVHTSDLGLTSHLKDGVQSALVGARCLIPNFCGCGMYRTLAFWIFGSGNKLMWRSDRLSYRRYGLLTTTV